MVALREEATECGGYFIVNGIERIIRLLQVGVVLGVYIYIYIFICIHMYPTHIQTHSMLDLLCTQNTRTRTHLYRSRGGTTPWPSRAEPSRAGAQVFI